MPVRRGISNAGFGRAATFLAKGVLLRSWNGGSDSAVTGVMARTTRGLLDRRVRFGRGPAIANVISGRVRPVEIELGWSSCGSESGRLAREVERVEYRAGGGAVGDEGGDDASSATVALKNVIGEDTS